MKNKNIGFEFQNESFYIPEEKQKAIFARYLLDATPTETVSPVFSNLFGVLFPDTIPT